MEKENKYYVYGHYTVKDNLLFYIGKGCGRRHKKGRRSKVWNDFVKTNEWYSKILHENLSSDEALNIEKELILNSNVLNTLINTETKEITTEILSWFTYDESSPTCLVWSRDTVGLNNRVYRKQGDVAGKTHPTSDLKNHRYIVTLKRKQFYVHRIVYALFNAISDNKVIDHIDGNPLNNKISNLREVDQRVNSRNTSRDYKSNTGILGVTVSCYNDSTPKAYVASWNDSNGDTKNKSFSCISYGKEEAFLLACIYRKEQIDILNKHGAGYTERHKNTN